MKRVQSWLLCAAVGGIAVIAACQSAPTTAMVKPTSTSVRPPCVLGCFANVEVDAPTDSEEVGRGEFYLIFSVTNLADTAIDIVSEATTNCPGGDIVQDYEWAGNATNPAELVLDGNETASDTAAFSAGGAGPCYVGMTAGNGFAEVKVVSP